MKKLKQDLKTVTSELKKLVKKTESLATRADKIEKSLAAKAKIAKKPVAKKPSPKTKTTKRKIVKKGAVRKKPRK